MAVTAPTKQPDTSRVVEVWSGGGATDDNEVILEIDARGFTEFTLGSVTGSVDVFASLDGTNFLTTAVGLINPTDGAPDAATTAQGVFQLRGSFHRLRFVQNGATAVTGFSVVARRAIT
jgi:hypothetical protein